MALILVPDKAEEPVEKALKALRKAWLKEALDDPQFYDSKAGVAALEAAVQEQLKDLYVSFSILKGQEHLSLYVSTVESVTAAAYIPFSVLAGSLLEDAEEPIWSLALQELQALCAALEQKLKG